MAILYEFHIFLRYASESLRQALPTSGTGRQRFGNDHTGNQTIQLGRRRKPIFIFHHTHYQQDLVELPLML
jgi:hypothetical protein